MWIQLALVVQLLIFLVCAEDITEASISSDGVNVVCKTPGGSGGFLIDGMDVVDIIKTLVVCRIALVLLFDWSSVNDPQPRFISWSDTEQVANIKMNADLAAMEAKLNQSEEMFAEFRAQQEVC